MKSASERYLLEHYKNVTYLTKEEQSYLIIKAKAGCKKSQNKLVVSCVKFIIMLAGKYGKRTGIEFEELIAEGVMGLIDAIRAFDVTKSSGFLTYAAHWIKRGFREFRYKNRALSMPKNVSVQLDKIGLGVFKKEDLSKYPDRLKKCWFENEVFYLDAPVNTKSSKAPNENFTWTDNISDPKSSELIENTINRVDTSAIFEIIFNKFNVKKKNILKMRHGLSPYKREHTLEEIAKSYGVTRENIRQIINRCHGIIERTLKEKGYQGV